MMFLAKELGKTLEEIMEITTLELTMWAAFYQMEGKKREGKMRAIQNGQRNKFNR